MNIGKTALGVTSLSMKSANVCSVELKETLCERDLGVMLNNKLNWKDQVDHAVQMAQSTLAMLKRTFVYWDAKMFVLLFTIIHNICEATFRVLRSGLESKQKT